MPLLKILMEAGTLTGAAFLPISKALVEAGFTVALAAWLASAFLHRRNPLPPMKFSVFYFLFLGTLLLSFFNLESSEWVRGGRGFLKWLQYLGIFVMLYDMAKDEQKTRRVVQVFIISMAVVSLSGFYQLLTGTDFLRGRALDPGRIVRMKASLGSPNELAGFLTFAVFAVFCVRFRRNAVQWGFTAFFAAAFILTFSRGALLAVTAALFLHGFLSPRRRRIVFAVLAAGAALLAVPGPLRANFVESLNLSDITIQERFQYWQAAWRMICDHPILGTGVNSFHNSFSRYAEGLTVRAGYAHNSYLQIWSETGIFSLIFFLIPLVYSLSRVWKKPEDASPFLPLRISLTAFAIQAVADNQFYSLQSAVLFWVWFGVMTQTAFNTASPRTVKT